MKMRKLKIVNKKNFRYLIAFGIVFLFLIPMNNLIQFTFQNKNNLELKELLDNNSNIISKIDQSYVNELSQSNDESDINIIIDGNIMDHLWSSDGTKIAYTKCPENDILHCELWVAERSPNSVEIFNKTRIYNNIYGLGMEDNKDDWILFQMSNAGEIWKIRDDGSNLTQLTFMGTIVGWSRFVPGTDLVYIKADSGGGVWKSYTVKDDGSYQLVPISGSNYAFATALSPTGNKLISGD